MPVNGSILLISSPNKLVITSATPCALSVFVNPPDKTDNAPTPNDVVLLSEILGEPTVKDVLVLSANLPPVVGTKGEIVGSVTGIFVVGTVRC